MAPSVVKSSKFSEDPSVVNSSKCAEESSENFEILTTDGAILVFELYQFLVHLAQWADDSHMFKIFAIVQGQLAQRPERKTCLFFTSAPGSSLGARNLPYFQKSACPLQPDTDLYCPSCKKYKTLHNHIIIIIIYGVAPCHLIERSLHGGLFRCFNFTIYTKKN